MQLIIYRGKNKKKSLERSLIEQEMENKIRMAQKWCKLQPLCSLGSTRTKLLLGLVWSYNTPTALQGQLGDMREGTHGMDDDMNTGEASFPPNLTDGR